MALIRLFIGITLLSTLLTACLKPGHNYSYYVETPIPDYSKESNWAALPWVHDSADALPPGAGLTDKQDSADVDVFFIYPTMNFERKNWNAAIDDKKVNKLVDEFPIRHQASAFNGSCKVYAPRYRQATLYSFFPSAGENGERALNLAYQDVRMAFEYYLKNFNHGRPIVIASHSQGSRHAFRLLKEFFDNNDTLRAKLICAYAIGFTTDTVYQYIHPCDSSSQTGCVLSWNSYKWKSEPDKSVLTGNRFCTNPLTWKRDTAFAGSELNEGGLPRKFNRIDRNVVGAKVDSGILRVTKPNATGYFSISGNYHVSDYSLFYMNIRSNVKERVDEYFKTHSTSHAIR